MGVTDLDGSVVRLLTRRRVLQAGAVGTAGLYLRVDANALAATHPMRRQAWTGLVGKSVSVDGFASAKLVSVADLPQAAANPALVGHENAFMLSFDRALAEGIHRIAHRDLGSVHLFFVRGTAVVNRVAGTESPRVVIGRAQSGKAPKSMVPEPTQTRAVRSRLKRMARRKARAYRAARS